MRFSANHLQSKSSALARGWRPISGSAESRLVPQARLSGPMPWVIAIMVALTVIAAAAGLSLRNTAISARAELSGGVTVQIIEPEAGARERQAQASMARLRATPGVTSVRQVPQAEVDALIEPWLGVGDSAENRDNDSDFIPVPALIDARMAGAVTSQRLARLRAALRNVAPAARVDAQSSWLRPVFDAIQSLQWLALAMVALLAFSMASAVLLAARSALGANRETIEIVHLLGGTDGQIARIFQRWIGIDAAAGGALGFAIGLLAVLFLGRRFASLGAGLINSGALGWSDWLLLTLIPLMAAALAMLTARISVIRALRRLL
jgi:cell division transport system permease protein